MWAQCPEKPTRPQPRTRVRAKHHWSPGPRFCEGGGGGACWVFEACWVPLLWQAPQGLWAQITDELLTGTSTLNMGCNPSLGLGWGLLFSGPQRSRLGLAGGLRDPKRIANACGYPARAAQAPAQGLQAHQGRPMAPPQRVLLGSTSIAAVP